MYRHLLVPVDDTDLSVEVVGNAVALARPLGARITFFHALADASSLMRSDAEVLRMTARDTYEYAYLGKARELLAKAEAAARALGVPCESRHVVSDKPAQAIVEAARAGGCDLIFMASHGGRGKLGMAFMSETLAVLASAGLPVLVSSTGEPTVPARAIGIIRDEHRSLAAVMHAWMHALADAREAGKAVDATLMRAIVSYVQQFPVKLHHPKEEEHLFRRLRERTTHCNTLLDELDLKPTPDQVTIAINTNQMNVVEQMTAADLAGTSLSDPAQLGLSGDCPRAPGLRCRHTGRTKSRGDGHGITAPGPARGRRSFWPLRRRRRRADALRLYVDARLVDARLVDARRRRPGHRLQRAERTDRGCGHRAADGGAQIEPQRRWRPAPPGRPRCRSRRRHPSRARTGHAAPLPRDRRDRAGRPDGAADPLPGQPAERWNGRSLQFGGGGFNGTLITGLACRPRASDKPSPLTRGFVTTAPTRATRTRPAWRCRPSRSTTRRSSTSRTLVQEGARRRGRADRSALRPRARQDVLRGQLRRRARRPDDGAALPARLRRHLQPACR